MQNSLDKLYEWERNYNMKFNASKFKWLQVGPNDEIKNDYVYMSYDCDEPITPDETVRDLGIMMNNSGNYSDHISYIYKKCKKRIGWILRSFKNRSIQFMRFVWRTYIVPIINYSSQLYSPTKGGNLVKLESLLKSFSSKTDGIGHLSYWDRIQAMKLSSIGRRFERYKILYSHKIINKHIDNCGFFWEYNTTSGTTIRTINTTKCAAPLREQSFHNTGPRLFNVLPRHLRDDRTSTPAVWKGKLDEFLGDIPDLPVTSEAVPGLCDPYTAAASNSLLHWIPHLYLNDRRGGVSNDLLLSL